jgi:hypothetical protein
MFPKSTANLKEGDYCLVPRDDGLFVPFVYVGKRGNSRSYFFGALADAVVSDADRDQLPEHLTLLGHALLHIKCYTENNTPIVGNLSERLGSAAMARIVSDINSSGVGHTTRVWGHRTIMKYANDVRPNKPLQPIAREDARTG